MALAVVFDMQRTAELRAADFSLENTFQAASSCVTATRVRGPSVPPNQGSHCAFVSHTRAQQQR